MRRLLSMLFAIGLVLAGVGVVRPQVMSRSKAAWEPVAKTPLVLPYEDGASIEINAAGEYIVFLEGPAGDPVWSSMASIGVQLFERQSRQALTSARQNLTYAYDFDGRHAQAIERVPVKNTGTYDLSLGRAGWRELLDRGFRVQLCSVKVVDGQAWKSKLWLAGGITAGVLMGIVALSMLSSPKL